MPKIPDKMDVKKAAETITRPIFILTRFLLRYV